MLETPVVVVCASGRDFSTVVTSLGQILLDPYYRTIYGCGCHGATNPASFMALIEKDWLALGHSFASRHGTHGQRNMRERAPVFALFLDCTWQVFLFFAFRITDLLAAKPISPVFRVFGAAP